MNFFSDFQRGHRPRHAIHRHELLLRLHISITPQTDQTSPLQRLVTRQEALVACAIQMSWI